MIERCQQIVSGAVFARCGQIATWEVYFSQKRGHGPRCDKHAQKFPNRKRKEHAENKGQVLVP